MLFALSEGREGDSGLFALASTCSSLLCTTFLPLALQLHGRTGAEMRPLCAPTGRAVEICVESRPGARGLADFRFLWEEQLPQHHGRDALGKQERTSVSVKRVPLLPNVPLDELEEPLPRVSLLFRAEAIGRSHPEELDEFSSFSPAPHMLGTSRTSWPP